MSEELFWIIYFTLVKTLLPPEAFAATATEVSRMQHCTMATTASCAHADAHECR